MAEDDTKNISKLLGINEKELREKYLEEKELFNTRVLRPKLIKEGKKGEVPYGRCIFLEKKRCRIHEAKPFQCRVGNCSDHGESLGIWLMLNCLVNKDDPESVRQYASYLKAGGKTIKGGKLEEIVPEKERLRKILSFEELR